MIAEIGVFCLILGFWCAFMAFLLPTLGIYRQNKAWISAASRYITCQFIFVSMAYLALTYCFLNDDFSLSYVVLNSSKTLPWFYKLCALWGGHEGSMLLWVLVLSFWIVSFSFINKNLNSELKVRIIVILALLSMGFILFILSVSNPFVRDFSLIGSSGKDLNPFLQDIGFLFHPPMLYMGYVGFAITFAIATAALWQNEMPSQLINCARPFALIAWSALTLGITLGSWWAYRELGWGGWWFWDPVENASFMPWLTSTALIHSLMIGQKRSEIKAWIILLSIITFSLSLIGTFLVRSGVLTSVHAFAVDPERGLYILVFLALVIGGSLLLFCYKAPKFINKHTFSLVSRESFLLLNNIILIVLMLTVLLGTLYPLIIDVLNLGKISVGSAYFDLVFVPIFLPLLLLMGVGVHLKWGENRWYIVTRKLSALILFNILLFIGSLLYSNFNFAFAIGLSFAVWVITTTLKSCLDKFYSSRTISSSFLAMAFAHIGIACTVLGIVVSNNFGLQKDLKMKAGDSTLLNKYQIKFISEEEVQGANYTANRAYFSVNSTGREKILTPEKRLYKVSRMAMTESAIDVTFFRDIYIALGEPYIDDSWSVRIYYKPMIRFIWGGGVLILIGGIIGVLGRSLYSFKAYAHQGIIHS